jgi:hypothetical protein
VLWEKGNERKIPAVRNEAFVSASLYIKVVKTWGYDGGE